MVGVLRRFVRQRRGMEATDGDANAACSVRIRDLIGATSRRDVGLQHDQVGFVLEIQALDVLIADLDVVVGFAVGGQRCQAERREERVLDRPEEGARRFRQGGQDHLDLHESEGLMS